MNFSAFNTLYRQQGYCVIPDLISEAELANLRTVTEVLLKEQPDDGGGRYHDIGRGESRRFLRHRHEEFSTIEDFLFSEKMRALNSAFVGPGACLFNEQFVVKGANSGASFAWHQDSAYVGFSHKPYLTVWIALDEITIDNGCLYVLPRNLEKETMIEAHHWDITSKELVGYDGDDPGVCIECASGTAVIFSSLTLHRSGANITDARRRAYICQYSPEAIMDPNTHSPKHFAKPVFANNALV